MVRLPNRFIALLLGALIPGLTIKMPVVCATAGTQIAKLTPAQTDTGFDYERSVVRADLRLEEKLESKRYIVRSLSFPSIGDNGQAGNLVTGLYYQSKLPGERKLVIVLPIWGTHTYPPRKITQSLLRYSRGEMNVLRITGKDYLFNWNALRAASTEERVIQVFRRMVDRVRTHVIDIRRSIDWAETQPGIDAERIGLVGFSLGAVVASLVVATEPRISAGVLAMGGANLHQVFATCFGRAKETRKILQSRFGWTAETFEKRIEGPLAPVNPTRFAGRVNPERIIMFDAQHDTCIPESGRDALWHAMGQPKRITWPYNHKMAFLTMTFLGLNTMRRKIYHFLEETL